MLGFNAQQSAIIIYSLRVANIASQAASGPGRGLGNPGISLHGRRVIRAGGIAPQIFRNFLS